MKTENQIQILMIVFSNISRQVVQNINKYEDETKM